MASKKSSCPLRVGINITSNFLASEVSPVSERVFTGRNGDSFLDDFNDGIIKKIWDLDKEVAKKFIYTDKETLLTEFPSINTVLRDDDFPYKFLSTSNNIPESKWKNKAIKSLTIRDGSIVEEKFPGINSDVLVKQNGGWVVDAGLKSRGDNPCTKKGMKSQARREACNLVTTLIRYQNRKGYGFRTGSKDIRKKDRDSLTVKIDLDSIDEKLGLIGIDVPSFGTYINLELPVTYWTRVSLQEKGYIEYNKARERMIREIGKTRSGKKSIFKKSDDIKRWANNLFNNGKDSEKVVYEFDLNVNNDLMKDKKQKFLKEDFVEKENGKIPFKSCADPKSIALSDHDGQLVSFEKKSIEKVFMNVPDAKLDDWKWICLSTDDLITPGSELAVIPEEVSGQKRSLFSIQVSKDLHQVPISSAVNAVNDLAISAWNAMVKSRVDEMDNATVGDLEEIPNTILNDLKKTSGDENASLIEEVYLSGLKEQITVGDVVMKSPYLIPRRVTKTRGITESLKSLMDGSSKIVGIETNLKDLRDQCS